MTIWKFTPSINDHMDVSMPEGAKILSVGVQGPQVCIWALVDPSAPTVTRMIEVRGTGHPAGGLQHVPFIGTVMLAEGRLVFHLFDGGEK